MGTHMVQPIPPANPTSFGTCDRRRVERDSLTLPRSVTAVLAGVGQSPMAAALAPIATGPAESPFPWCIPLVVVAAHLLATS